MAIQKITDTTEIKAGQWLCQSPTFYDRICSRPAKVVKSSGQRIYITNRDGEDEGDYIARKSAKFVCDTREEGDALHKISTAQEAEITDSTKAIKAKYRAQVDALIAGEAQE